MRRTPNALNLQARIAKLLKEMKPGPPHRAVVNWAVEFQGLRSRQLAQGSQRALPLLPGALPSRAFQSILLKT